MSRPTSVTKRDVRRDQLATALIAPDGSLAAKTLEGIHGLAELHEWSRVERWMALLDLQRDGRVRLHPMVASSNMRVQLVEPPAQRNLFEDGVA